MVAPVAPLIERTGEAYAYPLLIKQLLHAPLSHSAEQQIVYRDTRRFSYREFHQRVQRLAGALARLGVAAGDTVAVMDWDSHRYLEAYFAVPMMGATLMTVNVRLSPEQIQYTLQHCGAKVGAGQRRVRCRAAKACRAELPDVQALVLLNDEATAPATTLAFAGEYEALLDAAPAAFDFPDFDENTRATIFYTTGTTGLPKGVSFSHRQLVLHTLAEMAFFAASAPGQCFRRDDVYMPITPMFHVHAWGLPYVATAMGVKQVYPGRYEPDKLIALRQREGVTFSHCVPTILQMILASQGRLGRCAEGLEDGDRRLGTAAALAQAALERGIDVWAGYGMSETCPLLSHGAAQARSRGRRCRRRAGPAREVRPAAAAGRHPHRRRRDERRCRPTASRPARSSCARRGWRRPTTATPRHRRRCGTAAGCTRRTSAASTPPATCRSPTGSRT